MAWYPLVPCLSPYDIHGCSLHGSISSVCFKKKNLGAVELRRDNAKCWLDRGLDWTQVVDGRFSSDGYCSAEEVQNRTGMVASRKLAESINSFTKKKMEFLFREEQYHALYLGRP